MAKSEALTHIGLTKRQADIYMSLLKFGKATAYQIGQETGFNRPVVYDELKVLEQKGVVYKVTNAKKQQFVPKDPRLLITEAKERIESAEDQIEQLIALTNNDQSPKTLSFEGAKGHLEATKYQIARLPQKCEVINMLAFSPEIAPDRFIRALKQSYDAFGRAGLTLRGIMPDHQEIKTAVHPFAKKYSWEFRSLPLNDYASLVSTQVAGELVCIASREQEQHIVIENKDVANHHRQVFDILWNTAASPLQFSK